MKQAEDLYMLYVSLHTGFSAAFSSIGLDYTYINGLINYTGGNLK